MAARPDRRSCSDICLPARDHGSGLISSCVRLGAWSWRSLVTPCVACATRRSSPRGAFTDVRLVPTHGDLPDPDALWRLNGGHGRPPSAGAGTPAWDPSPPTPPRRPTLAAPPRSPPRTVSNRAIEEAPDRAGSMFWLAVAVLLCVGAVAAIRPDALYGPAAAVVSFMDAGPGFPQMLLYIALAAIPVTLLHELGHALAAQRLLETPRQRRRGLSRPARSARARQDLRVAECARLPRPRRGLGDLRRLSGTGVRHPAHRPRRPRGVGHRARDLPRDAAPFTGRRLAPRSALDGTLLSVVAVLNMIPFTYQERRDGPRLQTDGRLALDAARVLGSLR